MAIDIVQKPGEVRPSEDWRTGVVELPADHVYGDTAADDLSWQAIDDEPHEPFVLMEACAHTGEPVHEYGRYLTHSALFAAMRHVIELAPGAFAPERGPFRLVVASEKENLMETHPEVFR